MPRQRPPINEPAVEQSVIEFPQARDRDYPGAVLTLAIAEAADEITKWGTNVRRRDQELREFFVKEPTLASAIYSVCARNAAFKWELEGPEQLVNYTEWMLRTAISVGTSGWIPFATKISLDNYTTDNGFFIEIVRESPTSPVRGIAHLDSCQCTRTGDPKYPVIYTDRDGKEHKLAWYQVVATAEFPSAVEKMNGVGYSGVSRVLRASQIMRDIYQFKHEKVSGRFHRAIHFVGGVSKSEIADVIARDQEISDNRGLIRYIEPAIIASLDPEKPVSTATIEMASLPEGFDFDQELKWYIANIALGFGSDYQDFAPLPGGNLGTSAQSEVLHRKGRGKGPALFMETMQEIFHWRGVIPRSVTFKYKEQDMEAELDEAKLRKSRAEERKVRIESGEITPQVARMLALAAGDLDDELVNFMPEDNESRNQNFRNEERDRERSVEQQDKLEQADERKWFHFGRKK